MGHLLNVFVSINSCVAHFLSTLFVMSQQERKKRTKLHLICWLFQNCYQQKTLWHCLNMSHTTVWDFEQKMMSQTACFSIHNQSNMLHIHSCWDAMEARAFCFWDWKFGITESDIVFYCERRAAHFSFCESTVHAQDNYHIKGRAFWITFRWTNPMTHLKHILQQGKHKQPTACKQV